MSDFDYGNEEEPRQRQQFADGLNFDNSGSFIMNRSIVNEEE